MSFLHSLRHLKQSQLLSIGSQYLKYNPVRVITLKASPAASTPDSDCHEERNERLGRPMSPHVSHLIYTPQFTATLSIMHRACGVAIGTYIWSYGIACLGSDFTTIYSTLANTNPALLFLGKLIISAPLAYHFVNGVRHLAWDMGKFLSIKEVYTTGYIALAISTVALAYLLFA